MNASYRHILPYLLFIILAGCSNSPMIIDQSIISEEEKHTDRKVKNTFACNIQIPDTLEQLWEFDAHGNFGHLPLTVYGNTLFIGDLSGRMFAIDLQTGSSKGMHKHKHGTILSPPIFYDSLMIYAVPIQNTNETLLIFYDLTEGAIKNEISCKGKITSAFIPDDSTFYALTQDGLLYEFTIKGEQKLMIPLFTFSQSRPLVFEDQIIVPTDTGTILFVHPDSQKIADTLNIADKSFGNGIIEKNILYIGNDNGMLYAIDLAEKRVNASFQTNGKIIAPPTISGNSVFIANLSGELYALPKDCSNYIWRIDTGGIFNTAPLVFNNTIIAADMAFTVFAINKATGEIQKKYPFDTKLNIQPFYKNNTLILGMRRGILKAYEWICK